VLDTFDEIQVCVGYEANGVRYDYPPYHQSVLHDVKPIYEVLPGWNTDITGSTEYSQLPAAAKVTSSSWRRPRASPSRWWAWVRAESSSSDPRERCVVIGSGAREHALAWALAKSAQVVVTPGNPGSRPTASRAS